MMVYFSLFARFTVANDAESQIRPGLLANDVQLLHYQAEAFEFLDIDMAIVISLFGAFGAFGVSVVDIIPRIGVWICLLAACLPCLPSIALLFFWSFLSSIFFPLPSCLLVAVPIFFPLLFRWTICPHWGHLICLHSLSPFFPVLKSVAAERRDRYLIYLGIFFDHCENIDTKYQRPTLYQKDKEDMPL